MTRACLVIHPVSHRYVGAVARYIHRQLNRTFGSPVDFLVSPDIGEDARRHDLVFVIGDPFEPFARRPGCRFVLLNFSLLYAAAGTCSPAGRKWVERKYQAFKSKAGLYDYILDYHPRQAERLGQEFAKPADCFPIGLCADVYSGSGEREYDVCLVGVRTPRRIVIERRLARSGLRLSPVTGVVLEDIAARSRIVLNVHAYRTPNLELPRVVSALMSGAVLVTEPLPGISGTACPSSVTAEFPRHLYVAAPYSALVPTIHRALEDPAALQKAKAAAEWMEASYRKRCDAGWAAAILRLRKTLDR